MGKKNYQWRELGVLELGDNVFVTDPCYTPDVWCNTEVTVSPGQYRAFAKMQDERVAELRVVKEEALAAYGNIIQVHFSPEDICSYIGVDSGQCGIFDREYYLENYENSDYDNPTSWYRAVCNITLSEDAGVIDKRGAVSNAGYGDGMYYLYASYDRKDIVGLSVVFIDE